jgi:hypothetical protein
MARRASIGIIIAAATRWSVTREILLAVVSANTAGTTLESAVNPADIPMKLRCVEKLRRIRTARRIPPKTAPIKVNWAKPANGISPWTDRGTPAARNIPALVVVTAAAKQPAATVALGTVLVRRDGVCLVVIPDEVVALDIGGSFHCDDAFCTAQ